MVALRAIFFDIGDTLVFDEVSMPERFYQAAIGTGLDVDWSTQWERLPVAYRNAEYGALKAYLRGVPPTTDGVMRQVSEEVLAALNAPPLSDGEWGKLRDFFLAVSPERAVHHDAKKLLDALKQRGFTLGVISDWDESLPNLLTELGLRTYFDTLSVSASVGATKPNPLLFQDALGQAKVQPTQSIHVGDWYELDVAGARSVGMKALLFDHAGRTPNADCPRVDTFGALSEYLLALPT